MIHSEAEGLVYVFYEEMNMIDLKDYLAANAYPGRGILLGRSADGKKAVMAYFIMGRSANSRNRIFVTTEDGIKTEAYDPSKMTDPSLIIYHPVRKVGDRTIVTNGDQTDTIRDFLLAGKDFREALMSRTFEPDAPNYTPRISGLVRADGSYQLSILKSLDGDPDCACRYFYDYDSPRAGLGHIIHTYRCGGDPLPSYEGEPTPAALPYDTAEALAQAMWQGLNEDNKVSLFVRYLDILTGEEETVILNKNKY